MQDFDVETEIVVVGAGGCGLVAALRAAEHGSQVLLLEKTPRIYGNTYRSGGMIMAAGSRFQRATGILETPADLARDIFAKNHHQSDPAVTMRLCEIAPELVEWLVDYAGVALEFVDDFKYPAHSQFRMHTSPSRTGAAIVQDLVAAVKRDPRITLVTGKAVEGLIVEQGAVVGVRAIGPERIKAQRVILANNGFGGNPAMIRQYCPEIAEALYFGGEGNTGEGILWGLAAGAAVDFMDAYQGHASVIVPHGILLSWSVLMKGGIEVNRRGGRFGNETRGYSEFAVEVLKQPEGEAWVIFDRRIYELTLKFDEFRQAIEMQAFKEATTIAELALNLGLDPAGLATTLENYNRAISEGRAADFERQFEPGQLSLQPPFYGTKVTGALFHTQGGLKITPQAQVLRPDGSIVPNLYAGGGVAAGISGHGSDGYLSGNGLLTALGLGFIAGESRTAD